MPDHRCRTLCLFILILLGGSGWGTPQAAATVGNVTSLPPGGLFSKAGYRVTVDTRGVQSFGYRPVHVTIDTNAPIAAARTIAFELRLYGTWYSNRDLDLRVRKEFTLPAGQASASEVLYVPCHEQWGGVSWNVLVDGVRYRALHDFGRSNLSPEWLSSTIRRGQTAGLPCVLIIGENTPETVQSLSGLLQPIVETEMAVNERYGNANNQTTKWQSHLAGASSIHFRDPKDLVDNWLAYSSYDVVCLSLDQLAALRRVKPASLLALRRWTMAGGSLWIYGVGSDWKALARLEESLTLPTAPEPASAEAPAGDVWQQLGWHRPQTNASTSLVRDESGYYYSGEDDESNLAETLNSFGQRKARDPGRVTWVWRNAGTGWIAAFQSDKPLQSRTDQMEWVLGTMTPRRTAWNARVGLDADGEIDEHGFWDMVVPGIGLAPVGAFQILITLFVLAIGPLNFFMLRRVRRLQWLMITVPVGSFAVVSSLFAYALLTDGIGTRVRARSFCELEQRLNEETVASRLSYYAGLTPSDGLTFSKQTGVYPIYQDSDRWHRRRSTARSLYVHWTETQRLTGGWLPARTPTQYLALTAHQTDRELRIRNTKNGIATANFLGDKIEHLVLTDAEGKLHWGESIDVQQSATLKPIDMQAAQTRLIDIYNAARPLLSDVFTGYDAETYDPYRYVTIKKPRVGLPALGGSRTLATSLYEQRIQAAMLRLAPSKESPWRPRTYLAITKTASDEAIGIEGASQQAGFHVILGRW